MMKRAIFILSLMLVSALFATAFAEGFSADQYTYDELLEIVREAEDRIAQIERQRIEENNDRVISLGESAVILYVGRTKTLEATVTRAIQSAPEETALVWQSSDARVAKVSAKGVLTGAAAGEAAITCRAKDNELIEATVAVRVVKPITRVNLSKDSAALLLKSDAPALAQTTLSATFLPADAYPSDIVWTSSAPDIAAVDQTGAVSALKVGTATITATVAQEGIRENVVDRCKITVTQAAESIELNQTELTLERGKAATLTPTVSPAETGRKTVVWTTSDAAVATVSAEGRVYAKTCGECVITCTAKDGGGAFAACRVTVTQEVTAIKLDQKTLTLPLGGEGAALTATLSPAVVTDGRVKWSSSDPNVATVSEDGFVRAIGAGKCKILCEAQDGSGVSASASVFVPSISVEQDAYTIVSKLGEVIPVMFYGESVSISFSESAKAYFDAEWEERWFSNTTYIVILPKKAGSGVITITDEDNPDSRVKITVVIDHAAVYDSVSYPKAIYAEILRDPDAHRGEKMSVSGKVLQKSENGANVALRVGTSGVGTRDSVYWIDCAASVVRAGVNEGDEITVYGECSGAHTYSAALEDALTLPALTAEKIIVK